MYFNIFQNVYSCDGKAGFSAAILRLECHMIPQNQCWFGNTSAEKQLLYIFVETMIFF